MTADRPALYAVADRHFARARLVLIGLPALLLADLVRIFFAFEGPALIREADGGNARVLVSDMVRHKVHITRDNRNGSIEVAIEAGRFIATRDRTEVFRYFARWELFFFILDSPYHGLGLGALTAAALSGEAGAIWTNDMWRHGEVARGLFETIPMASLGTTGAAILALPLSFLAVRGFTPLAAVRVVSRRPFDFLRGVDGLIWTIVLSRAFGPGPLTGMLAILIAEVGTFGKMVSEALENVDRRQLEGIRSSGAGGGAARASASSRSFCRCWWRRCSTISNRTAAAPPSSVPSPAVASATADRGALSCACEAPG
ncbi:hypothetical protein SAMN05421539_101285 [Jannaschia seohaensis]|uniref:Phosphonate transport system permease protein n=1 Tax=Jannaschia seohaensis TaxID=475081 RepID=A0A2Y9A181_9RHOB|nr:hypothetical protein BCF38_101285 [Jannaschia seohaensis]SSA38154.1 hypothetical protein SAMN05421539_101285 [Jannaschia seohaensis]